VPATKRQSVSPVAILATDEADNLSALLWLLETVG